MEASDDPLHWRAMAALLERALSEGWPAARIEAELHSQFPRASRGDVYFSVSIALTMLRADFAIADLERRAAERERDELQRRRAA